MTDVVASTQSTALANFLTTFSPSLAATVAELVVGHHEGTQDEARPDRPDDDDCRGEAAPQVAIRPSQARRKKARSHDQASEDSSNHDD